MKQTNLYFTYETARAREAACPWTILVAWGCYGIAMALLWQVPHDRPWVGAVLWGIAGILATGLALALWEF